MFISFPSSPGCEGSSEGAYGWSHWLIGVTGWVFSRPFYDRFVKSVLSLRQNPVFCLIERPDKTRGSYFHLRSSCWLQKLNLLFHSKNMSRIPRITRYLKKSASQKNLDKLKTPEKTK